eukprot:7441607-Alexandrium_andersonii.AAC.1
MASASAWHGDGGGAGGVWATRGAGAWRAGGRPAVGPGAPRGVQRGGSRGGSRGRAPGRPGAHPEDSGQTFEPPCAPGHGVDGTARGPTASRAGPGLDLAATPRAGVRARWGLKVEVPEGLRPPDGCAFVSV